MQKGQRGFTRWGVLLVIWIIALLVGATFILRDSFADKPPFIVAVSDIGPLAAGTTETPVSVTTNKPATCTLNVVAAITDPLEMESRNGEGTRHSAVIELDLDRVADIREDTVSVWINHIVTCKELQSKSSLSQFFWVKVKN